LREQLGKHGGSEVCGNAYEAEQCRGTGGMYWFMESNAERRSMEALQGWTIVRSRCPPRIARLDKPSRSQCPWRHDGFRTLVES
jgi:hypothetical protein